MKNNYILRFKSHSLLLFFILFYATSFAQVGVETDDPTTTIDVSGTLALREGQVLALNDGNNKNISLGTEPFSFYTITGPTNSFNITGIIPLSGADGQIVTLQNNTDAIMNVIHNSNSNNDNRIFLSNGKDFQVRGKYASVTLQYNSNSKRWSLINGLKNVQTWYANNILLYDGKITRLQLTAASVTATSGVSVDIINIAGLPDAEKFNIKVEYVEAQDGFVIIRIKNDNPQEGWGCSLNYPSIYTCTYVQVALGLTYYVN